MTDASEGPDAAVDGGPCSPDVSARSAVQHVVAGTWHTCVSLGSGEVACWGRNDAAQLGSSDPASSASPMLIAGSSAEGTLGCTSVISAGHRHGCASTGHGAECWGVRLGLGGYQPAPYPVPLEGLGNVRAIASGSHFACALGDDGHAACLGLGYAGQLGSNDERDESATAVAVTGLDGSGRIEGLSAIDAGIDHTCGLLESGEVACWGSNHFGRAAPGVSEEELLHPTLVAGVAGAIGVSAGGSHTCALVADGAVWCWGGNEVGQLGRGTPSASEGAGAVPGLSGVTSVAAGGHHACAASPDGVVCWGANEQGQLGDGTTMDRASPVAVTPPDGMEAWPSVVELAAGALHTCALADGAVYCWGDGLYAQAGALTDRTTPERVNLAF